MAVSFAHKHKMYFQSTIKDFKITNVLTKKKYNSMITAMASPRNAVFLEHDPCDCNTLFRNSRTLPVTISAND